VRLRPASPPTQAVPRPSAPPFPASWPWLQELLLGSCKRSQYDLGGIVWNSMHA
jgi:hypothetical protein